MPICRFRLYQVPRLPAQGVAMSRWIHGRIRWLRENGSWPLPVASIVLATVSTLGDVNFDRADLKGVT
jgi:hypothetical protein